MLTLIMALIILFFFLIPASFYPTTVSIESYGCMRSHMRTHLHLVGLHWTSDCPIAGAPSGNSAQNSQETDAYAPTRLSFAQSQQASVERPRLRPRDHGDTDNNNNYHNHEHVKAADKISRQTFQ